MAERTALKARNMNTNHEKSTFLITGNLGYIGSALIPFLRKRYPNSKLIGFDSGYFAHLNNGEQESCDVSLDAQHYGDIRHFPEDILNGVSVVIHLAALSNDPMGNKFQKATSEINLLASKKLAASAKASGIQKFIFASSCSIYGFASSEPRTEDDELNPLTEYSKSKIKFEEFLYTISNKNFSCFALRFATACGASPRLRFDLVLNDFVYNAITKGHIQILSNGKPWRPLIDVKDMCKALVWPIDLDLVSNNFNYLNVGSDGNNFQVLDLAKLVAKAVPNVDVKINSNAPDDLRSYKVSFAKFKKSAPNHQPETLISQSIEELSKLIRTTPSFNEEKTFRLKILESHISAGKLSKDLFWAH